MKEKKKRKEKKNEEEEEEKVVIVIVAIAAAAKCSFCKDCVSCVYRCGTAGYQKFFKVINQLMLPPPSLFRPGRTSRTPQTQSRQTSQAILSLVVG
ncbi:hypothetical protein ElyMa_003381600 [Elysia marginata]|uniref:4Fe-4S ferredoxin-type domain-containing protein n=1 Tax=Elysia marginata TaxID=1093978 RepID=A0AAV4JLD9_9GAST|nr:hypothetical protein ElyMa_003381600 [Elysia marginata]